MEIGENKIANTDASSSIVYSGIECTGDVLREIDSDPSALRVKRSEVKGVIWRYGLLARSPILQVVFGAALSLIGLYPARTFQRWISEGGTFPLVLAFLVPIPAIGVWLVVSVVRRGYFLDVDLGHDRKRFVFKGRPKAEEVEAFVETIKTRWNLTGRE